MRRRSSSRAQGSSRLVRINTALAIVYLLLLLRYIELDQLDRAAYLIVGAITYSSMLYIVLKPFRIRLEGSKLSRWAKLKRNGGKHTDEQWERLKARYSYRCVKCQRINVELTKDHIVPLQLGGTDSIDNLQPLCRSCNSAKGATIADYR